LAVLYSLRLDEADDTHRMSQALHSEKKIKRNFGLEVIFLHNPHAARPLFDPVTKAALPVRIPI
jgi:hypothetical protein